MLETTNLGALFDPRHRADEVALIDCRDWDKPREWTHRGLDAAANACARGLLGRGLVRGQRVAILSANRAEFLIGYFGCLRAGLVAVPVNHKVPAETITFVLRDAEASLVLCDAARHAALETALPCVDFDDPGPDGFEALLDPGPFQAVAPADDEDAMVLYTSGSTGRRG